MIVPLTELTADKWKSVQAVTLGGVFYGVKHGARQILEQGRPGWPIVRRRLALT